MSRPEVDPTQATSLDLSRSAFVGITAATAIGGSTASALGQTTLGQPHAPIVPEDDPAIEVQRVGLRRPDGIVSAYAASPADKHAVAAGVVVVMHIWGVDAVIRDTVRRFAKAGFAAIAPDLYSRFGAPSGDGVTDSATFRPFAKELDRKQYDGDLRSAALWLTTAFPALKVGVLGFCMGGHIALVQAIDNGDVFSACCPFYGSLNDIDPDAVHIPICGSYGARDTSISADDVRLFRTALRVPNDIRVYPTAGHAFFDDTRASYVPAAADDAWKRTISFLRLYLGKNA